MENFANPLPYFFFFFFFFFGDPHAYFCREPPKHIFLRNPLPVHIRLGQSQHIFSGPGPHIYFFQGPPTLCIKYIYFTDPSPDPPHIYFSFLFQSPPQDLKWKKTLGSIQRNVGPTQCPSTSKDSFQLIDAQI